MKTPVDFVIDLYDRHPIITLTALSITTIILVASLITLLDTIIN